MTDQKLTKNQQVLNWGLVTSKYQEHKFLQTFLRLQTLFTVDLEILALLIYKISIHTTYRTSYLQQISSDIDKYVYITQKKEVLPFSALENCFEITLYYFCTQKVL